MRVNGFFLKSLLLTSGIIVSERYDTILPGGIPGYHSLRGSSKNASAHVSVRNETHPSVHVKPVGNHTDSEPLLSVSAELRLLWQVLVEIGHAIKILHTVLTGILGPGQAQILEFILSILTIKRVYWLWMTRHLRYWRARAYIATRLCGEAFYHTICGDVQGGCLYCMGCDRIDEDCFNKEYKKDAQRLRVYSNCCDDCFNKGKPLFVTITVDAEWFYVGITQVRDALRGVKNTILTNVRFNRGNRVSSLNLDGLGKGVFGGKVQFGWAAVVAMMLDKKLYEELDKDGKVIGGTGAFGGAVGPLTDMLNKAWAHRHPFDLRKDKKYVMLLDEKKNKHEMDIPDGFMVEGYIGQGDISNLRDNVTLKWKSVDQIDLKQIRTDCWIEEIQACKEQMGPQEAHEAIFISDRKAQAIVIGPYCKDTYIASKHSKNLLDALAGRHYTKKDGPEIKIDERHKALLHKYTMKCVKVIENSMRELNLQKEHKQDDDGKNIVTQVFNFLNGDLDAFSLSSKKWSEKRTENAAYFANSLGPEEKKGMTARDKQKANARDKRLESEVRLFKNAVEHCLGKEGTLETDPEKINAYQVYRREMFVKLNEALNKVKARGIVSSSDEGTEGHLLDTATPEALLFSCLFFEMRSVKHANGQQLRDRFARRLEHFVWAMSNDYGRFDSTLGIEMRAYVENNFIQEVIKAFGLHADNTQLREVLADRLKGTLILNSPFWTAICENPGRESGDRGTSVLNYLTNIVVFCVMIHIEIVERCNNPLTAGKIMWSNAPKDEAEAYAETVLDMWFQGEDVGFDTFGEGDDNLPLFTEQFIANVAGFSLDLPKRFVATAKALGLILEPQYVGGKAPEGEGLYRIHDKKGRVEFTSKIIKCYRPAPGEPMRSCFMPKIDKFLKSTSISFCTEGDVQVIALTKILSMMQNVLDVPLMFLYAKVLYQYHYLKLKYRRVVENKTDPALLTTDMLIQHLGDFDARRLIDDRKFYVQNKWRSDDVQDTATPGKFNTFDAMFSDLCAQHEIGRNCENRDQAIREAMLLECPKLTFEVQEAAFDALTKVYEGLYHEFDHQFQLARNEVRYGRVTWAVLKPRVEEIRRSTYWSLNEYFRGYFCEVFWGEDRPRI